MDSETDVSLIERFLSGEQPAFKVLFDRYRPKMVRFLQTRIKDESQVEDLVQETFIRVYRHLHRFDRSKKFSTWIYKIASNLAKNEWRRLSRNPIMLFQQLENEKQFQWKDKGPCPDELADARDLMDRVDLVARQLPESQRTVFLLRGLEEKTYEEIADITSTNLGTVKSRLHRARTAIARTIPV